MDAEKFIQMLTIYDKGRGCLGYFNLNPAQKAVLPLLETEKRLIIVKARQLGISPLVRAWHFYSAYVAKDPHTFAVISHTRDSAEHLAGLDRRFFENLPVPLQRPLKVRTQRAIVYKDTGAGVRVYTSGGRGGTRSFAINAAHLSEFAFGIDQAELLAQVLASAGMNGQVIIESTVNQIGDTFHKIVQDSLNGENEWKVIFLPWSIEPKYRMEKGHFNWSNEERALLDEGLDRQQVWWRRFQISTMGKAKFKREYPATVQEAFQAAEDFYFDHTALSNIERLNLGEGPDRYYPGCDFDPDAQYIIGVDTGGGTKGGDYSALTVLNVDTMQPEYHLVTNAHSPTEWSEAVLRVAHKYNNPLLVIEGRSWGYVVLSKMQELNYPNLWKPRGSKKVGWDTNVKTRPMLFESVREMIESNLVMALDRDLHNQMMRCVVRKGRPDHPKNAHDDLLISLGLCYVVATKLPMKVERSPHAALIDAHIRKERAKKYRRPLPWTPAGGKRRKRY